MGDYCRDNETRYKQRFAIFLNSDRGWTFSMLARELGMHRDAIKLQLRKCGFKLETPPGHTLSEKDIETITAVVLKRKSERLYGR